MKKVSPGDRLSIPASTYNAFIDAAQANRGSQADIMSASGRVNTAGLVYIRNDSLANIPRFGVLGIDKPIFAPEEAPNSFFNRIVLSGVFPVEGVHEGRFVILSEPLAAGKIGRGYAAGCCVAKVNVVTESAALYADIADDETEFLSCGPHGTAQILWKEEGTGEKWAIIRFGVLRSIIPVTMTQVGGSDGTASAAATWTYDIEDVITETVLAEAVNPAAAPHKWKRPYGKMGKATFGYAHMIFDDDEYIPCIGWCNEIPVTEECD